MKDDSTSVKLFMEVSSGSYSMVDSSALYAPISEAATIAGVSYETMSDWANSPNDPIPHIPVGRAKKLIRVSAIPAYAKTKEVS